MPSCADSVTLSHTGTVYYSSGLYTGSVLFPQSSSSRVTGFPPTLTITSQSIPSTISASVDFSGLAPGSSLIVDVRYTIDGTQALDYSATFVVPSSPPPPSAPSAPCSAGTFVPGSYGLGVDGAPVPCNYWTGSKQFQSNIAPLLTKLLLFLFGSIFAIWIGIKVGKSLIHKTGLGHGDH